MQRTEEDILGPVQSLTLETMSPANTVANWQPASLSDLPFSAPHCTEVTIAWIVHRCCYPKSGPHVCWARLLIFRHLRSLQTLFSAIMIIKPEAWLMSTSTFLVFSFLSGLGLIYGKKHAPVRRCGLLLKFCIFCVFDWVTSTFGPEEIICKTSVGLWLTI